MIWCWVKKYGFKLGRMKWFDAESKGMVRCWIEGDGSLLDPRIGLLWGFKQVIGCQKLIWRERKTKQFGGSVKFCGSKDLAPQPKLIWQEQRVGAPTKTNLVWTQLFSFSLSWSQRGEMDTQEPTEKKRTYIRGKSAWQTHGGRNNKEVLASGVPPKGRGSALTFGGTEGLMLGRRGWFDALTKGMVWC